VRVAENTRKNLENEINGWGVGVGVGVGGAGGGVEGGCERGVGRVATRPRLCQQGVAAPRSDTPAAPTYATHSYRAEAARMSKTIWSLEKEREKSSSEAREVAAKHQEVGGGLTPAGPLRWRGGAAA
jgi:hypothetical protein